MASGSVHTLTTLCASAVGKENEMKFEIDIVSNSDRKIVRLKGLTYIYIPMAMHEAQRYGSGLINPCWRIKVTID